MPNGDIENNRTIERDAMNTVIAYEEERGRGEHEIVGRRGYDLITRGKKEERHIEVKATAKGNFMGIFLSQMEFEAMLTDRKWFLYLVSKVHDEANKCIHTYNKESLLQRLQGITTCYRFRFSRDDFID